MFPYPNVIAVCWGAFWLYWIISALGSKRSTASHIRQFVGVRIGVIALAALLFGAFRTQRFEDRLAITNHVVLLLGFILLLIGLLLAVWARVYLGKNWGMPMTQKEDPELVTDGPYKYIRHPIYSGILLGGVGTALASSLFWLLIPIVFGVYFIYSAIFEERLMMQQFPKVYPAYKRRTKMLIPFIL